MHRKQQLYQKLVSEYKAAHNNLSHNQCDIEISKFWCSIKNDSNWENLVQLEIKKWKLKCEEISLKRNRVWSTFFTKKIEKQPANKPSTLVSSSIENTRDESTAIVVPTEDLLQTSATSSVENTQATVINTQDKSSGSDVQTEASLQTSTASSVQDKVGKSKKPARVTASFPAPRQDQLKLEIANLNNEIVFLANKKSSGFASDEELERLKKLKLDLAEQQAKLKIKIRGQARQQRKRQHDRDVLAEIRMNHPEVVEKFGSKKRKAGRPRIEETQSELLNALVDIATYGCGADQKRRSNMMRSIHTLDELTAELNSQGFQVKRGAVYLRLLPRNSSTIEGKRHITTVPVKLVRATNDLHKQHVDTKFCKASISYLEEVASVLGPKEVLWLSQDDKARVPIGKTAANKQTPLVMHLEYRVQLPDHDWIVAEKHKLIPSVYAFIEIDTDKVGNKKAVTYSGPTYISIRSAKHCSSTAYSHAKDMATLMDLEEFETFCKDDSGEFKPIIIITTDGGPDENPRYEKRIDCAIAEFKKFNADAIFIATNAPGRSAFNRVERRMAPLSRDLAGMIIDHQQLGAHLNEKGETIDVELEKKNFEAAGKLLAEIWSETVIDKHPTIASYVPPEESEICPGEKVTELWKSAHVREGHYFLQIVKCKDRTCCSAPRSSIFNLIDQFIPAPMCMATRTKLDDNSDLNDEFASLFLRLNLKDDKFRVGIRQEVPFDICCPSLKDVIQSRTCECGIQHASKKSLNKHIKSCLHIKRRKTSTQPKKTSVATPPRPVTRPKRLAAIRQGEKMIVWSSRLNAEHVDWFDEEDDDIAMSDIVLPIRENNQDVIPIVDIETKMTSQWTEI
ncbi:uncharacterized protein LOC119072388 isoform X2 [Bradysia coprophila]|uniref:uncharacterized protein LOC119072388 isoform X2 n=1 Tax=Bradysia coprophila TaxID=38358 RepID=UPI00187D8C6C|nr:uncharacterized protein LOC119072388 isoform X2 [Bradysia coprophila]